MKQQIESKLHCKATAELKKSIQEDLEKEDKSLRDLLSRKETDEVQDTKERSN